MVKWKEEQYMEQLNVNLLQHFFHSTTFFFKHCWDFFITQHILIVLLGNTGLILVCIYRLISVALIEAAKIAQMTHGGLQQQWENMPINLVNLIV